MKKTRISILFIVLSTLSIATLGFSVWISETPNSLNSNISHESGKIFDINSYIKYNDADIFTFCKDGVVKNDIIVNNGEITIPFYIDLMDSSDKIQNHIQSNTNNFVISTSFTNGSSDITKIFSDYLKSASLSYSADNFSDNYNIASTSNDLNGSTSCNNNFNINLNVDTNKAYFKIKYSFLFPTLDTFNTEVFKNLNRGKFWFTFKAEIRL